MFSNPLFKYYIVLLQFVSCVIKSEQKCPKTVFSSLDGYYSTTSRISVSPALAKGLLYITKISNCGSFQNDAMKFKMCFGPLTTSSRFWALRLVYCCQKTLTPRAVTSLMINLFIFMLFDYICVHALINSPEIKILFWLKKYIVILVIVWNLIPTKIWINICITLCKKYTN